MCGKWDTHPQWDTHPVKGTPTYSPIKLMCEGDTHPLTDHVKGTPTYLAIKLV